MSESKQAKHTPGPVVWLNQGEAAGEADCGCLLDSDHDESGFPAFIYCPEHSAAPDTLRQRDELLEAAELLVAAAPSVMPGDSTFRALKALRAAIASAKGKQS